MIICLRYVNALVHSHYPSTHKNIRALLTATLMVKYLWETEVHMGHGGRERQALFRMSVGKLLSHICLTHAVNVAINVFQ